MDGGQAAKMGKRLRAIKTEKSEIQALRKKAAQLESALQHAQSESPSEPEQSRAISETIDAIARAIDSESGPENIYSVALNSLRRALRIERAAIICFSANGLKNARRSFQKQIIFFPL